MPTSLTQLSVLSVLSLLSIVAVVTVLSGRSILSIMTLLSVLTGNPNPTTHNPKTQPFKQNSNGNILDKDITIPAFDNNPCGSPRGRTLLFRKTVQDTRVTLLHFRQLQVPHLELLRQLVAKAERQETHHRAWRGRQQEVQ